MNRARTANRTIVCGGRGELFASSLFVRFDRLQVPSGEGGTANVRQAEGGETYTHYITHTHTGGGGVVKALHSDAGANNPIRVRVLLGMEEIGIGGMVSLILSDRL